MKKRFYDVGTLLYVRNQKCGAEIVAACILGGAALLSGSVGAAASSSANNQNVALQKETMYEQMAMYNKSLEFNHEEAEIARNFNLAEAEKNRQFQAGMLNKNLQWFENYNSPTAQVQRYLDAGLNPASLAGNLGSTPTFSTPAGSAATSSPASAAGLPQLTAPHVSPVNPLQGVLSGAMDAMGSYFGNKKTIAETDAQTIKNEFLHQEKALGLKLTKSEIDKNLADINLINKDLAVADQKIKESVAIVKNLSAQTESVNRDVELKDIQKIYQSDLYKGQVDKLKAEYNLTDKQARAYTDLVYSQIAQNYGGAASAYASARYNNALTELTPFQRDNLIATKQYMDAQTDNQRVKTFLDRKFGSKERAMQLKVAGEQYDKLTFENNGIVRGIGIVKDVAVTAASVVGTVYGVKALGASAPKSVGSYNVQTPQIYTGQGYNIPNLR